MLAKMSVQGFAVIAEAVGDFGPPTAQAGQLEGYAWINIGCPAPAMGWRLGRFGKPASDQAFNFLLV
jgi:hypothetical protein